MKLNCKGSIQWSEGKLFDVRSTHLKRIFRRAMRRFLKAELRELIDECS